MCSVEKKITTMNTLLTEQQYTNNKPSKQTNIIVYFRKTAAETERESERARERASERASEREYYNLDYDEEKRER